MTDKDLARFKERIKTIQAVTLGDEVDVQSHQIDVPYQSREVLLDRIDKDLYRDAMALDVDRIAKGAVTATQIEAAYEPLNSKCDMFEYCVLDFIYKIMELAGIDDEPTFTRSMIVNVSEKIQNIVQASPSLPEEYVTEKILTILGDKDRAEEIIAKMQADSLPNVE
jgi:Phage portal protein, SPP1 Gp6-like.